MPSHTPLTSSIKDYSPPASPASSAPPASPALSNQKGLKPHLLSLWGIVVSIPVLVTLSPAIASIPIVKTIKQSQVSGKDGKLHTINVWRGHGVSLSFYKLKETIKRVWIDDPSKVLVDSDGCLQGIDNDCESSGAGLLHLRRINQLDIQGIPKTQATHLTVITESRTGRNSYHFRVFPANDNPKYSQITIVPDAKLKPLKPIQKKPDVNVKYIGQGIDKALRNGLVARDDELYKRVHNLLQALRRGENLQLAAFKSGVSMRLIRKLQKLGRNSTTFPITKR
ncbi:MAG: hypothetical protein AAFX46_03765 [Cyanobacteria bacterium J06636_27]